MVDRGERIRLALVGLGLLVAVAGMVVPWWSMNFAAGNVNSDSTASPFAPGDIPENSIQQSAVTAVGVLVLVAILSIVGGLVLWIRAMQTGEAPVEASPWLAIAGGALLLVAALAAVGTWPEGDTDFWDSTGSENFSVSTAADVGWYLTLLAGAMTAAGGFGLMRLETARETPQASDGLADTREA